MSQKNSNNGYTFFSINNHMNEYDLLKENYILILEFDSLSSHDLNEYLSENMPKVNIPVPTKPLFDSASKKVIYEFKSENFYTSLYIENYEIILVRNNSKVAINIDEINEAKGVSSYLYNEKMSSLYLLAGLFEDRMELSLFSEGGKFIKEHVDFITQGLDHIYKTIYTDTHIDPCTKNLIMQNAIEKQIIYNSEEDLVYNVKKIISSVNPNLYLYNGYKTFWNNNGSTPKQEVDAQHSVLSMLSHALNIAGLKIESEAVTPGGNVDFYIYASVKNKGVMGICLELKLAHRTKADIEKGFFSQLPEYVKRKNALYGIYLVLWYNSDEYDIYDEYCTPYIVSDFLNMKNIQQYNQGTMKKIMAYSLDVSKPIQASKLK